MLPDKAILKSCLRGVYLHEGGDSFDYDNYLAKILSVRRISWLILVEANKKSDVVYVGDSWNGVPFALAKIFKNVHVFVKQINGYGSYRSLLEGMFDNVFVNELSDITNLDSKKKYATIIIDNSINEIERKVGRASVELLKGLKKKQLVVISNNRLSSDGLKHFIKRCLGRNDGVGEYERVFLPLLLKDEQSPVCGGIYPVLPNTACCKSIKINDYIPVTFDPKYKIKGMFRLGRQVLGMNGFVYVTNTLESKNIVQAIIEKLSGQFDGCNVVIEGNVTVLETGAAIFFLSLGATRAVLRVFFSKDSLDRALAGYRNMHEFGGCNEWANILLPTQISDGTVHGVHYLCEQHLQGLLGIEFLSSQDLRKNITKTAQKLLTRFYEERVDVGNSMPGSWEHSKDIEQKIVVIKRCYTEYKTQFEKIECYLNTITDGIAFPSVWLHGDYHVKNILFSEDGKKITGLIDWDNAVRNGMPFMDLLHFICYNHVITKNIGIGATVVGILEGSLLEEWEYSTLCKYADSMSIDINTINFFVVVYWVTHIFLHCERTMINENKQWVEANVILPMKYILSIPYGSQID